MLERRAEIRTDKAARARALREIRRSLALDAAQSEAFVAALSTEPLALIQGPPGTGKTRLLAHAVAALARRGERVFVTAFTHRAVNHALRKIAEIPPRGVHQFRLAGFGRTRPPRASICFRRGELDANIRAGLYPKLYTSQLKYGKKINEYHISQSL